MSLDQAAREKLVRALAASMIEHAEELTSLDQAIGDGDHGLNMKRGFEAVLATLPGLADKSLPEMLKAIGMTLVMKVGGVLEVIRISGARLSLVLDAVRYAG